MLSRKLIAFRENAQRLIDARGRLYLWTFTLPKRISCKDGAKMWNYLLRLLRRWVPGFQGCRVYERHPGGTGGVSSFFPGLEFWKDSHGLHVHFVSTRFYCVNQIRETCKNAGWGRVHVVQIKGGKNGRKAVMSYLAKYLNKKRHPDLAGLRLVGYVGIPNPVRHRDIVCSGHIRDLWDAAKELQGWGSLNFFGRVEAVKWLNRRCLTEGGRPIEQIYDFKASRYDTLASWGRKHGNSWTQAPESQGIMLLHDLGIIEADDNNRARRFIPKSLRMPRQNAVCMNGMVLHN